jgi:hypothetical protein
MHREVGFTTIRAWIYPYRIRIISRGPEKQEQQSSCKKDENGRDSETPSIHENLLAMVDAA